MKDKNFWSLLRTFCLEGTIAGLKYLYIYPDRLSRCFWTCNILLAFICAWVITWLLYCRFAEMPTRITIENQYEPAHSLPYPSITLCSPNQMTASFMAHFNKTLVDGNRKIDLEKVLPMLLGFYEIDLDNDINDLAQLQILLDKNRYTISDIMTASPQSCDDFLKLCFFDGVKYARCSELFTPILTTRGLCCAFNNIYHLKGKRNTHNHHFKVRNVVRAGHPYGLIVVTDYNPEDAVDYTILNAGSVKVLYNDYHEFPSDDESMLVQSSVESYHIIRAEYTYCSDDVKVMPFWSRKCYFEDEHHLRWFGRYHNCDCDLACLAEAVLNACHCHLFYLPHPRPDQLCDLTSIPCIVTVKVRMRDWMTLEKCDCPRDCESRKYNIDMTIGNMDAMPYMINNPFEDIVFNMSTSLMHFFFPRAIYVKQKQETIMSVITLVSNLGGVFGLFLGCSGISVLEIISFLYAAIKSCMQHRNKKIRPVKYCK